MKKWVVSLLVYFTFAILCFTSDTIKEKQPSQLLASH